MHRRKGPGDPGFGSDSFLDVLSNIVGILIILLVMAGVQLGRSPLPDDDVADLPDDEEALTDLPAAAAAAGPAVVAVPDTAEPSLPDPSVPPPATAQELSEIARQRQQADAEDAKLKAELAELLARRDDAQAELATVEQGAEQQTQTLQERKNRLAQLSREIGERRQMLTGLLAEFEETQNSQPAAHTIKHRLTPVSQEVNGEEVHLRLENNRVSVVPIMELLERVKQQVERRRDVAMSHGGYKGVVGPIEGYSLEFVIESRKLSPHEERQTGLRDGYSLELSRCVVIPDPRYQGETLAEALQRGSRFAMALRTAAAGATLTMWTYPDSFGMFRKLQATGHAEGFLVAGRPMPTGTPIMGDRRLGTRSAAQ